MNHAGRHHGQMIGGSVTIAGCNRYANTASDHLWKGHKEVTLCAQGQT